MHAHKNIGSIHIRVHVRAQRSTQQRRVGPCITKSMARIEGVTCWKVQLKGDPPVVPEEDKVPLVVEGDYSPPSKLWVVREEGGKHASHCVP